MNTLDINVVSVITAFILVALYMQYREGTEEKRQGDRRHRRNGTKQRSE